MLIYIFLAEDYLNELYEANGDISVALENIYLKESELEQDQKEEPKDSEEETEEESDEALSDLEKIEEDPFAVKAIEIA